MESHKGDYLISTDKTKLQADMIHHYLKHEAYWTTGRTRR